MDRIRSVDTFRVLAILAVIALHTARHDGPRAVGYGWDLLTLLDQVERFAVPLFFIVSGYFWVQACTDPREHWMRSRRVCQRVLLIFVSWALVYAAVAAIQVAWTDGPLGPPRQLLHAWREGRLGFALVFLEGGTAHLWFLPALAIAVLVSGALLAHGMRRTLIALAIGLFAIGLAGKPYAFTPIGFFTPLNLRNGPFFGLIFFVTGIELRRWRIPSTPWPGLLLALAGLALQVLEVRWLHARWGTSLVQDYVVSTWIYGLGVGLMALSDAAVLRLPVLASLGPLVLGIYASHYLFVELLQPVDETWRIYPAWDALYVALVFAAALMLTRLLARFRATRRLVA
jgi:surface polysaccharide O-acyltransferase-like enzyme